MVRPAVLILLFAAPLRAGDNFYAIDAENGRRLVPDADVIWFLDEPPILFGTVAVPDANADIQTEWRISDIRVGGHPVIVSPEVFVFDGYIRPRLHTWPFGTGNFWVQAHSLTSDGVSVGFSPDPRVRAGGTMLVVNVVPEPSATVWLLLIGLALAARKRPRR